MTPNDLPLHFDEIFDTQEVQNALDKLTVVTQSKYLYIQKRAGGARNRDAGFDLPIQDCTKSPDLDDMITNGPGELTISEGDNGEMSWEWDDYIIIRTGE